MSATVNNNLQNLLAHKERMQDASRETRADNKKPTSSVRKSERTEKPEVSAKSERPTTQRATERSTERLSDKEIARAEQELAQFDEVLNDQIENGDLIALSGSAQAPGVLSADTAAAVAEVKAPVVLPQLAQMQNVAPEMTAEMSANQTGLTAEQALALAGTGTLAVKANQAPVVASNNQLAQLGEGENVVNLMNAKKAKLPQTNPYAKDSAKNMFTNLNKEVKPLKVKADALLATPEGEMLKKVDLMNDVNKAVHVLAKADGQAQGNIKGDTKVLDLSKIQVSNTQDLINNISDYITQNAVASKSKVDMAVQHDELGRINVSVARAAHGQVNVEIQTMSEVGHKFFSTHQNNLISHLSAQGVNVADFKLENNSNSSFSNSNQNQGGSEQFSSREQGQNQSENNNRREDTRRRDELWNLLKKDVA